MHAQDQKVIGASPATSPCSGGYGKQGGDCYGDQTEAEIGGNRLGAHSGHGELLGVAGDDLQATNRPVASGGRGEGNGDDGDGVLPPDLRSSM